MKRVLITGANSYVGTHVEEWLMKEPENYYVETLDMKDPNWRDFDFSSFDVVFHVAGIAHIKETKNNVSLYYKINRDLAFNVARTCKDSGVNHFIFMSSMSVYGLSNGVITMDTIANPKTAYGVSKFEAEKLINSLATEKFIISILRPPVIYGKNSPGNFNSLLNKVKFLRYFPDTKNKRSMLYIGNLVIIVKNIIDNKIGGLLIPDNLNPTNIFYLIRLLRLKSSKPTTNMKILIPIIHLLSNLSSKLRKIFGTLYYDSSIKLNIKDLMSLEETIDDMY